MQTNLSLHCCEMKLPPRTTLRKYETEALESTKQGSKHGSRW